MFWIVILVLLIILGYNQITSGNQFRDSASRICIGMSENELISIMGQPTMEKQHQDGSYEYIYEKSEWKGWFRGGTQTRRMEIVINSDDIIISIAKNDNVGKSGW